MTRDFLAFGMNFASAIPMEKKSKAAISSGLTTAVAASAASLTLSPVTEPPLQAQVVQESGERLQNQAVGQQPTYTDEEAINKYFDMGYDYCDSLVLAAYWEEGSFYDAKLRLGHKMLDFGPEEGTFFTREARAEALKQPDDQLPAWYTDDGYSYEDAEALAKYWGTNLTDSKFTLTRLAISGHDLVIEAALNSARRGR